MSATNSTTTTQTPTTGNQINATINNTTTAVAPITNGTQPANPYHYIDMLIGAQVAQQLAKFNTAFTMTNVAVLIMMLSVWEIKSGLSTIIRDTFGFVKENYRPFFSSFAIGVHTQWTNFNDWKERRRLASLAKKHYVPCEQPYNESDYVQEPMKNVIEVEVEMIVEFAECLVNFLKWAGPFGRHPDNSIKTSYKISNQSKRVLTNMENEKVTESLSEVAIDFHDVHITLENSLSMEYDCSSVQKTRKMTSCNSLVVEKQETKTNEIDKNSIKYARELVNDPILHAYLESVFLENVNKFIAGENEFHPIFGFRIPQCYNNAEIITLGSDSSKYKLEIFVINVLQYHYPNLILDVSFAEVIIIFELITRLRYHTSSTWDLHTETQSQCTMFTKDNILNFIGLKLPIPNTIIVPIIMTLSERPISVQVAYYQYVAGYGTFDWNLISSCRHGKSILSKTINSMKEGYLKQYTEFDNRFGSSYIYRKDNKYKSNTFDPCKPRLFEVDLPEQPKATNPNTSLKFKCTGLADEDHLRARFEEFMHTVKSLSALSHVNKENINIYKIHLEVEYKDEELPNPKYAEYEEKKKLLMEAAATAPTAEKDQKKEKEHNDFDDDERRMSKHFFMREMFHQIPPKTIVKTIKHKKIQSQQINFNYKTLDTLYMKERDETRLMSVISKFHSKKELLKSLGLPNKLCIMLEGSPGTGKSSAILTIASYLKKNIYYLSFENLDTNEDLQSVFDHVIKNCDGGIIVVEDIDAIGTLFHSRALGDADDFVEVSTNTVDKTEKLNLSYVLNLLQGTITPDGLIFMATTNHLEKLDPAFYRDGRFDLKIKMTECDEYQLNKIYQKFIGRSIPTDRVAKLVEQRITPAKFIFSIKDYVGCDYSDDEILKEFI
jgi:hypothetical protein